MHTYLGTDLAGFPAGFYCTVAAGVSDPNDNHSLSVVIRRVVLLGINHLSFERTQARNIRPVRFIIQPIADKDGVKCAGFHFTSFDVFHSNLPSTGGVIISSRFYEGDVSVV